MMTSFKLAEDFLTDSLNRKDLSSPTQVLFSDVEMKQHREELRKNVAWLVADCQSRGITIKPIQM